MNRLKQAILIYNSNMEVCNWIFCTVAAIIAIIMLAIFFPVAIVTIGAFCLIFTVVVLVVLIIQFLWEKLVKWAEKP